MFGFALTVVSSIVGVTAGAVQGYFGGRVDLLGGDVPECPARRGPIGMTPSSHRTRRMAYRTVRRKIERPYEIGSPR